MRCCNQITLFLRPGQEEWGLGGGASTFPGPSSPKRKQPSSTLIQEDDSDFPPGQVQLEIPGLAHLTALSLSPIEQSVEKKVPR